MRDYDAILTFSNGVASPGNLAINSTGAATQDGTEIIAEFQNNAIWGPTQAAMAWAAGGTNTSLSGTPGAYDGVVDAAGASQWLEAMQKGVGAGPGSYVPWGSNDDPGVTGARVLLLSGQGVLIATYPDLDAACWITGNDAAQQAAKDAGEGFWRADDAVGTNAIAAGTYLILPESRDYLYQSGPRSTIAFWHTINGYGSSSTNIQKFTTEVDASDDVVVTIVNSATLGFTITANMDCYLYVTYTSLPNAGAQAGLSKNSAQLTTSVASITTSDRLVMGETGANVPMAVSWAGLINTSDVIRPHTSGAADGAGGTVTSIHVLATEAPRENANTIIGIVY